MAWVIVSRINRLFEVDAIEFYAAQQGHYLFFSADLATTKLPQPLVRHHRKPNTDQALQNNPITSYWWNAVDAGYLSATCVTSYRSNRNNLAKDLNLYKGRPSNTQA